MATIAGAGVFVVVLFWRRFVSLASMAAAVGLPTFVALDLIRGWTDSASAPTLAASTVIGGLVLLKHRANFERLRTGTEPRLGEGSVAQTEATP